MFFRFSFSHFTFQAFALILMSLCNIRLSAQFENINVSNHTADQSETHITISPLNSNLQLATWNDFRSGNSQAGYGFSTDGGLSWPFQNVISGNGVDPSGGFDRYGNAFYCYMVPTSGCFPLGHGPIFVSRTTNLGNNWDPFQVSSLCSDKPLMTIDNTGGIYDGRIYVTYTHYPQSGGTIVYFAYSTNNGANWTSDISMGPASNEYRGSMPAVGPNGELYLCWRNNTSQCSLFVTKSTNGGVNFSSPVVAATFTLLVRQFCVKATITEPNLPNIAVDPLNSNVYIVYTAKASSGNFLRVWWTRSTNGGSSFSSPQEISSSAGGTHQVFGTMTVNTNHRISVFFETLLIDFTVVSRDYFIRESFDDGLSFRTPVKINEQQSTCAGRDHHYQWIASINDCTFPCWTATLNSTGEVYTGKGVTISLSNSSDATSSGSVRKSVYKTSNLTWNNIFISDNSLFYHYSKKDGKAWSCREKISGSIGLNSSSNPSLSLYNSEFHTIYKNSGSRIYYNRTESGTWSQPYQLANVENNVTGIASTVDGSGTGHVTYSYDNGLSTYIIKHGTFSTSDPIPTITNFAQVTSSLSAINSPTIYYDNSSNPHIAWYQGGDIYYSFKQLSMWSSPFNVSSSLLNSEAPCIGIGSDNKVHISWQEETASGPFDIYYRNKTSAGVWGSVENISNNSANSIQPYMEITPADQPLFVWSEGGMNSPYDIVYSYPNYGQTGTVEITSLDSRYPTFTQRNNLIDPRMLILWTDGPINRYLIENNYIDLIPQNLPQSQSLSDSGWFVLNSGTIEPLRSIFFVNNSTGFVTGGDVVLKTTNSGINWNIYTDSVLIDNCSSIFFPNLTTGYLATNNYILKTTNQGQNWLRIYPLQFIGGGSLFFLNPDTGFATHHVGQFSGVSRTTNGGINWVYFGSGDFSDREVFFPSVSTGYAAFRSSILKTTNTGNNWFLISSPLNNNNKSLYFINNNTGYLSSQNYFSPNIHKTTDGGNNWQLLQPGTNAHFDDVFFVNNDTGYCAGDSAIILRTTNAGITWQRQFSNPNSRLQSIFFTSANTGYVVGTGGIILKTTTGGSPIGVEPISNIIPTDYQLYQNYPNPFNPVTTIKFDLPHSLYAKLEVYDALGRTMEILLNRRLSAGIYEIQWNASMFASGIYYVRLEAGNFSSAKKMVLLK